MLSAVLNDPEHMPRAQSMLAPDAFYHHGNRLIWQHLLERHAGNQPLDPVLITTALREQGKLEEVGGAAGIAELFTFVPSATNFEHYAKVVQENYLRRETIRILAQGIDSAQRLGEASRTDAAVVEMIEDLLTPHEGLAIGEREVETKEVGGSPRHVSDVVLGVVRDGKLLRFDDPQVDAIEKGDRLLYVRNSGVAE